MFKLGKKPARANAVKLRLSNYIDRSKLPPVPVAFGHEVLIKDWEMLGNDQAGDCVFAGGAHETMLWNRQANHPVTFLTSSVLSDYSAVTGYVKGDDSTDQGTDVQEAAKYRQNTGLLDAKGNRHKIAAYVSIEPGNILDMKLAAYLFGAVGIGINLTQANIDQINKGQKWIYVHNSPSVGGHYVPLFGWTYNDTLFVCTWGIIHTCSSKFLIRQCDEAICYLSEEMLTNNKTIDGFDLETLKEDLLLLRS